MRCDKIIRVWDLLLHLSIEMALFPTEVIRCDKEWKDVIRCEKKLGTWEPVLKFLN